MAIYSSVPPPGQQAPVTPQQASPPSIDIESWSVSAMQSLSISASRADRVTLSIPLGLSDDTITHTKTSKPRKELLRRDSQKRREAVLRGKEGSRRRQRWENDRLLHVPNAQPPLPSDWEVHPTYPVHSVPYYLAPLWDAGVRHRAEEIAAQKQRDTAERKGMHDSGKGRVPQELRQKLKKSKGAKTLLQDLENEIRKFVRDYERKEQQRMTGKAVESEPELDSEDEEIVFVGRDKNGLGITMSDEQKTIVEEELEREKKVYEAALGDSNAPFARWLVHSIAGYYGLTSRSVTVGNPARREAYVGIKTMKTGGGMDVSGLPRPLWGMI